VAVHFFHAVTGALTREVVTLHHTRITASLAGTRHIYGLDFRQRVDRHLLSHLIAVGRTTKLAHKPFWLTVRLLGRLDTGGRQLATALAAELRDMTTLTASGKASRLIQVA
jgi:hypothetical protein